MRNLLMLVFILFSIAMTICFYKAAEQGIVADVASDHYRCMQQRTEHCLNTEVAYDKMRKELKGESP